MFLACIVASATVQPTSYNYRFAASSPLAKGRWVKIRVAENGVYEISYDRLRQLGFANPENVSVFGHGGKLFDSNFCSSTGEALYKDVPEQVPVLHSNGKLLFYGYGPENITMVSNRFERNDINIYANTGAYLLTDSTEPLLIATAECDRDNTLQRTALYDYVYHEIDKTQGTGATGRNFWGEDLLAAPEYTWQLDLPFALAGDKNFHRLQVSVIVSKSGSGRLMFGLGRTYFGNMNLEVSNYKTHRVTASSSDCTLDDQGREELVIRTRDLNLDFAGLDYWLFTYSKTFADKDLSRFSQERVCLALDNKSDGIAKSGWFQVPEGAVVMDVTEGSQPTLLPVEGTRAYFPEYARQRFTVVFDPSKTQRQIERYAVVVENQNLHADAAEGADLLIVASPEMLSHARELAKVHEEYDGTRTVIATPEQIYNEFTGGTPDPIAYRALAKMLYQSPGRKLKNILFFGPIYADYRNVSGNGEPHEKDIIAMQEQGERYTYENRAANDMDYFGSLCDYRSVLVSMRSKMVEVGVGLLPVTSDIQGANAVNKSRRYLESNSFANLINETFSFSCPGDDHLHDRQSNDAEALLNDYMTETSGEKGIHKTLVIDNYTQREAYKIYKSVIERGKLFAYYFGHAGVAGIGGGSDFISPNNFLGFKNRDLGFAVFAGCDLSYPDLGVNGIGQMCVTDAPRAFVGSFLSTRTVSSTYNYRLFQNFVKNTFQKPVFSSTGFTYEPRTANPTVGEVYAGCKSVSELENELCYIYVGDPALPVPIPLRGVNMNAGATQMIHAGEVVTLSGTVNHRDGSIDTSFNGEVMVKLLKPEREVNIGSKDDPFVVNYNAEVAASMKGEANAGRFSLKILVPDAMKYYAADKDSVNNVRFAVGVWDKAQRLGGNGSLSLPLAYPGAPLDPASTLDNLAPQVELAYNAALRTLDLSATDNVALEPGIGVGKAVTLSVDGIQISREIDSDATASFSAKIPMLGLTSGSHEAVVTAIDLAGNQSAAKRFPFSVPDQSPLSIVVENTLVTDEARFNLAGEVPEGISLVVYDSAGNLVYDAPVGAYVVWDASEATPGCYRAALRHPSPMGSVIYSNFEEFSVIR